MNETLTAGREPDWSALRPEIDSALSELGETDRAALLLRYFDGRTLAETGARLGLAENAARMRIDRALEKLRGRLARRGITSTTAALGSVLTAQLAGTAPAGLAAAIAGASLAGSGGGLAGLGALLLMNTTKIAGGAAVLAALLGLGMYLGASRQAPSPGDDTALRRQLAALRLENRKLVAELAKTAASAAPAEAPVPVRPLLTEVEIRTAVRRNLTSLLANVTFSKALSSRKGLPWDEAEARELALRDLKAVDGEDYGAIDFARLDKKASVTTASGLVISYEMPTGNGNAAMMGWTMESPEKSATPDYYLAQAQALATFRVANPGRSPTALELAEYFSRPEERAAYLTRVKALRLQQELGPAMLPLLSKAGNAYVAAYGVPPANGGVSDYFAILRLVAPLLDDSTDRERFEAVWNQIDREVGP